ncbi:MAG: hypothetical protein K0R38_7349 [Polyangiaceae bacterium]|nr:hypothetical protein [Polyangiaceae bacterium]
MRSSVSSWVVRLGWVSGAGAACALVITSCGNDVGGQRAEVGGASAVQAGAGGEEPSPSGSGGGAGLATDGTAGAAGASAGAGGLEAGADGGYANGGAGGADASPTNACHQASECDDSDACTQDGCDAVAGCVHVNPELDCRRWSESKCAAAAIEARGSGEQVTCVPPTTFAIGASICADQMCSGKPGCELKYSIDGGAVTTTPTGYDFTGRVVTLHGAVAGKYGALQCQFEVGLAAPEPFLVHYALDRPGCSQHVEVEAAAQASWTGIAISSSSPQCDVVVSLLRALLTPAQLDGYLTKPLETLTCAACAPDCPGGIACR